jgi:hypothetical protein
VPPSFGFQERLEGAAVLRVPGEAVQLRPGEPGGLDHLLVVEEGDGVPVLGGAVAVSVLADPVGGEPRLVLRLVDAEVVERLEHLEAGELAELLDVVGEHVRLGARDEARGELRPVVVPAHLGDLDLQARVLLLEALRAGLVGGQLVGVPQPVRHRVRARPGRAALGASGGQGQGQRPGHRHDRTHVNSHACPLT